MLTPSRWSTKHPLHLTSAPAPGPSSPTPSSSPYNPSSPNLSSSPSLSSGSHNPEPANDITTAMADSIIAAPSLQPSFSVALAMLLYNVCYLAFTQSVDVGLSGAGDVLSNLWAVCCSSELGKRSHSSYPLLPPPTPPNFALDFQQLLQATTAPASRTKVRPIAAPTSSRRASSSHGSGKAERERERLKKERERERILEEEEWDLVEDEGVGMM
jgi:hypothetical protein